MNQCPGASSDDGFDPFRRCTECGRAFRGIESSDASAGTGAHVENPSACTDCIDCKVHGFCDLGYGRADGSSDLSVFRIDDPKDPFSRKKVDINRARIAPFSRCYLFSRISAFW